MTFPFHPLADAFPLMNGASFEAFVADIKANGLRDPIVVLDGKIIDGRNRQRACDVLGIAADYEEPLAEERADPLAFVISRNLHRRHLDDSQRAMVGARLETMKQGRPGKDANLHDLSRERAAELVNVSARSVASAREVLDSGAAELVAAVDQGQIAVSVAAKLADLPREAQIEAAADPEKAPHLAKRYVREKRERELADRHKALPARRYGVILADPEWRFEPWNRDSGMDRAADNHYPTSELTDIAARDVASIAAEDCVLFLCATRPMLPQALDVMKAWGFGYRTCFVWSKNKIGTGYWNRDKNELLLIGVKGDPPAPAPGDQWESQIDAPAKGHSEKPEAYYLMIEEYFPNLPKIELNATNGREGWDSWGLEAPADSGVGDSGD